MSSLNGRYPHIDHQFLTQIRQIWPYVHFNQGIKIGLLLPRQVLYKFIGALDSSKIHAKHEKYSNAVNLSYRYYYI